MQKVRLAIVAITIGIGCMVGLTQTAPVEAAKQPKPKVTICHRTNAVTNPYRVITVAQSAVDGIAGNSGKKADHYGEHPGPVASSLAVATALKQAKTKWGDIIPPVPGVHDGLNWTAEGQAIYNNGCKYVTPTSPDIAYEVTCVLVENVPTVRVIATNNGDGDGTITVNGEDVAVSAGGTVSRDFASGNQVTIVLNGQTVYDAVVRCTDDENPNPDIDFDLVCDAKQKAAVITFSNSGNADGTVTLNDEDITVLAGVPVTRTIPTGTNGVGITIEIDGKVVFKQLVNCQPGKGGGGMGSMNGNGTSPSVTDTKQLPNTAGETDQVAMTIVGSLAAAITLAGVAVRSFLVKPF